MAHLIKMIEGSSTDTGVIAQVKSIAQNFKRIMVLLDSNHTHEHVLAELDAYAPLTTVGSYCCVFDSVIEDLPHEISAGKPWAQGNNPKTAIKEYLNGLSTGRNRGLDGEQLRFVIDQMIQNKLIITNAPDGYLRRVD